MTVEDYALALWQNGTNDDVWDACFRWADDTPELEHEDPDAYPEGPTLTDVAGELLERIIATPDFTVGDLTHEQVVAAILRRHPLLGPATA
jgi:hypothetical protein